MTELTVTDFARSIKAILDQVEYMGEEVILTRSKHKIARIIPGSPHLTAIEAMGGIYDSISDKDASDWVADSRSADTLDQIADPWK